MAQDLGPKLPELSVELFRKASRTFPGKTGIGHDALSPRQMGLLSDAGVQACIDMLLAVEDTGCWPGSFASRIVFLAKQTGGFRPIAVPFALVRLQTRLRRDIVVGWEARNHRP